MPKRQDNARIDLYASDGEDRDNAMETQVLEDSPASQTKRKMPEEPEHDEGGSSSNPRKKAKDLREKIVINPEEEEEEPPQPSQSSQEIFDESGVFSDWALPHLGTVTKALQNCQKIFKEAKIPGNQDAHINFTWKTTQAKEIIERVKNLKSTPMRCVPAGYNASGKTFFINDLALGGPSRLEQLLEEATTLDDEDRAGCSLRFPVISNPQGRQAVTIYNTTIRHKAHGFRAYIQVNSEKVFDSFTEQVPEEDDHFGFNSTLSEFEAALKICRGIGIPQPLRESQEITLVEVEVSEAYSLLDQLKKMRQLLVDFEKEIKAKPVLSWMFQLVIEGNFPRLDQLGIELIDTPGVTDELPLRRALSIVTMKASQYLLLFVKGRVPTSDEFEILKPAFSGPAVSTPLLVFADNPKDSVNAASKRLVPFDSIPKNHKENFSAQALSTLEKSLGAATTATEAAIFQRMLQRASTFLFVSTEHSNLGEIPPSISLNACIARCFHHLVLQRLKPAVDLIGSSLREIRKYALAKGRAVSIGDFLTRAPSFQSASASFPEINEADIADRMKTKRREPLLSLLANTSVISTFWTGIFDAEMKSAAKRLFAVCHLKYFNVEPFPTCDNELEALQERLDAAYNDAVTLMQADGTSAAPDDDELVTPLGRPRNDRGDEENSKARLETFKVFHEQLVAEKQDLLDEVTASLEKLRKKAVEYRKKTTLYKTLTPEMTPEMSPDGVPELTPEMVHQAMSKEFWTFFYEVSLSAKNSKTLWQKRQNFYDVIKEAGRNDDKATKEIRQQIRAKVNLAKKALDDVVKSEAPEVVVTSDLKRFFQQPRQQETSRAKRAARANDPTYRFDLQPTPIQEDPNIEADFLIGVDGENITIKAKHPTWMQELQNCVVKAQGEPAERRDSTSPIAAVYPIFSYSVRNSGNFLPILNNPAKGLESGKEYLLFLLVESSEVDKYRRAQESRELGPKLKIVSIPKKRGPEFAATLMLHFQASCRKALKGICAFELFHYVSDTLQQVCVFDDARLCTTPCSLLLALDYSRLVFLQAQSRAMKDAESTQKLVDDRDILDLLRSLVGTLQPGDPALIENLQKTVKISAFLGAEQDTIIDKARAGQVHSLQDVTVAEGFWEKIRDRAMELHKRKAEAVYGVGITTQGVNNLNPYNELKLRKFVAAEMPLADVTRYNYRDSGYSNKPVAILNSLSLESVSFMSKEAFFQAHEGANPGPISFKSFSEILKKEGYLGYMIFNFEAVQSEPRLKKN